jgi:hypothetical protein
VAAGSTHARGVIVLERIVARLAKISPARHRELVQAMSAELASITDPGERARFALGALAAIVRLSLRGYARGANQLIGLGHPEDDSHDGGRSMSRIPLRQLMRRHMVPFAVSFLSLTALLLT